jgi:hypothetical protein
VADREGGRLGLDLNAGAGASGISDKAGARELKAGVEHVHELVFVLWLHDGRTRDAAEVGNIKKAVVGRAVGR